MAGDDLLVGTGIDLAGLRRDTPKVLAHFRALGSDITRALAGRALIPDLTGQGREAAQGLARGLSSGIASELRSGLTEATAVLRDFSAGASTIDIGDLSQSGEAAGRSLVLGLRRGVQRDALALRDDVSRALAPTGLLSAFQPAITAARSASGDIALALGSGGVEAGRQLTAGLNTGLVAANAGITAFARVAGTTLASADLLGSLAAQGERAGGLLVSGITASVASSGASVQRAVTAALIPTNLAGEMARVVGGAGTEASARLIASLSVTGTTAGRALVQSLAATLAAGTTATLTTFASSVFGAINLSSLLGDVTPVGLRIGGDIVTGIAGGITRNAATLRATLVSALTPGDLAPVTKAIDSELRSITPSAARRGQEIGDAVVQGITTATTRGANVLRQLGAGAVVGTTVDTAGVQNVTNAQQDLLDTTKQATREIRQEADALRDIGPGGIRDAERATEELRQSSAGARRELRALAGVLRGVESGATGRQINLFAEGTRFDSTRIQSLERLQQIEKQLQTTLKSTGLLLTQRIQLERELANTSNAIDGAHAGVIGALGKHAAGANKGIAGMVAGLGALGKVFPAIGAVGAGYAILGFTQRTIAAADAMKDFAERSGVSSEVLSVLGQVAEKSGASQESLSVGLRNLSRSVTELRGGSKSAAADFAAIGLSAKDFAGLSVDQMFKRVADAMGGFETDASKTAVAMALFGRSGEELIPTLNALANGGFDAATARARALGGVMSGEMVNAADEFNDAVSDLKTATGGFGRGLLTNVLPPITEFINSLIDVRRRALEARDSIPAPFRAASGAFAQFASQGPLFATVFGDSSAEAARTGSFGDRIREATRHLLGLRTAAETARAAAAGLANDPHLAAAVTPIKPTITTPVTRDDEIRQLRELHSAYALNANDLARARTLEAEVRKEIASGTLTREQRAKAASDLAALRDVRTPKADTKPVTELLGKVRSLIDAYGLAADTATRQQEIIPQLVSGYDSVNRLLQAQTNQASATSNELREQLNVLKEFDPVLVGLARRQFGDGANVPEVTIPATADIVDIRQSTVEKRRFTVSLLGFVTDIELPPSVRNEAAKKITLPAEFDAKTLSDSLRGAIDKLGAAQATETAAKILGTRQQQAAATKVVNVETQNLTRTFKAAIDAEIALAASGKLNVARINEIIAAASALGINLTESTGTIERFSDTLANIGNAVFAVGDVAREIGGISDEASEAIESVGRLAGALSDVSKIKFSGTDSIFSSVDKFLEGIPAIGNLIASVVKAHRSIVGEISGRNEENANNAIRKENTEAIVRLSQDVAGFSTALLSQQLTAANAIRDSGILQQRALTSGFDRGFKNVEALDKELRASGSSLADLKRRAEELGVTITDADGRVSAEGLKALERAIRISILGLTRFSDSLEDFSFLANARADIFDLDGPQQAFNDAIAVIQQFTGGLGANLTGIDISTQQGRQRAEAEIRRLYELASKNLIPEELLKGLSAEEFVNKLVDADNALDTFAETANSAASDMVNVVQGFRDFNLDRAKFLAQEPKIRTVTPTEDLKKLATEVGGAVVAARDADLAVIAQALREATAATEIERLSDTISTLAESVKVLSTTPVTLSATSTGTARTSTAPVSTTPTTAQPTVVYQLNGDINFTQPVQNPEQMTDAIKSVFVRRARSSSNPEVKRVVNHLP